MGPALMRAFRGWDCFAGPAASCGFWIKKTDPPEDGVFLEQGAPQMPGLAIPNAAGRPQIAVQAAERECLKPSNGRLP